MTLEGLEKVKEIFAETLNGHYAGEVVFGPIVVNPDVDWCGDDYLRVLIVYDGDQQRLEPDWTGGGLILKVRPKLEAAGITEFPSPSFIDQAEYRYFLRRGKIDSI